MIWLYKKMANSKIVVVSLLFGLVFSLYLFPTDANNFRARGDPAHTEIQREYQKAEFIAIVEQWGKHTGSVESAVQHYQAHLRKLDFVFPFVYVTFLLSTIACLTNTHKKDPSKWTLALFLLPIVGGMFDFAENYMHISMLQGTKSVEDLYNISTDSIRLSFIFTMSKFSLLILPLLVAILISLYRRFFEMDKQFPGGVKAFRNPELGAIFRDEKRFSDKRKEEIKEELEERLDNLEVRLKAEKDESRQNELKEKIREIKKVLRLIDIHTRQLGVVIETEKARTEQRRKQAAEEFEVAFKAKELSKSQKKYKQQLANEKRRPVGLAFSGGGIRSASFNLGLVQALAKYGVLPWVDYLTSVSGGGFTAACMTTLLSLDKKTKKGKREYYHFNTQWDYFPFNPELKAFDGEGVAHEGNPTREVGPPLQRGTNTQLKYLRDKGNYLVPRTGWLTRDVLRGVGAVLVRIGYTVLVFLLVLLTFSAFHYGATAALTRSITKDIPLDTIGKPQAEEEETELSQLTVTLQLEDGEYVVDVPVQIPKQEEQEEDVSEQREAEPREFNLLYLIIGSYEEGPESALPAEETRPIPTDTYLLTLAAGFLLSVLTGWVLAVFYREDPTRKYRLRPWKSPEKDVTLDTYLAINSIRVFALVSSLVLVALTAWLWVGRFQGWPQSVSDPSGFYWAWIPLFVLYACVAGWFVFKDSRDYRWARRGLPEQLRTDNLVTYTVAGLFVWAMALLIAWLRFPTLDDSGPHIFWIWLPAVFTLGGLLGLAVFRNIPLTQHVYAKGDEPYDVNSIGWLGRAYFRILNIKPDPEYEVVFSGGVDYRQSRWSSLRFRSIFWTLQGLFLYGLVVFLVLAFLALPHYFSVAKETDPNTVIPLSAAIISTAWATVLSYVNGKADFKPESLIAKVIALPGGLRNYVLGILVIVLNLSIVFLMESRIDSLSPVQAYSVGVAALGALWICGRFADFNYLTPHYFFRDRMAEAFMTTEVDTEIGKVKTVRDDRNERLWWMTPDGCSAPYHVILTTLNLPGSWHLGLKDRKSQPFILSKYYCGSEITGYVGTRNYQGGTTKYARAIALSGAAVSSSLGYHTFFAQAFMTTLLNVRLGLWMVSPQQYTLDVLSKYARPHQKEGRVFWPTYLWDEARGRISERRPLINLTDGEHTGDNIGLYPLFQRRCKVIIAGDAGQDPEGLCKSLFHVIRHVNVDMGIEVDINVDGLKPAKYDKEKKEAEPSKHHFAVGKIRYPATINAQGKKVPEEDGWLIYFRPAVTSGDPSTILKYWETRQMEFPHPTTADQFFDEEQFEVQRCLGEWTVKHTLKGLKEYYEQQIEDAKGQKQKEKLGVRKKFVEEMVENERIDFDTLSSNPGLVEELVEALQVITNAPDDKKEE